MPTVYGKVDCYTDPDLASVSTNVAGNTAFAVASEIYTGLYSFMQALQLQSVVDLVAMYTGSNGNGVGYWDQGSRFRGGAFSVWKWKANGSRPWDWYMYMHMVGDGVTTMSSTTNQVPTRDENGTTIQNYQSTVLLQAAIGISSNGLTSYNPWNGTLNTAGAAYKGFPVWVSGSTTNSLFVFPRSNNPTGSNNAAKDNCMTLFHSDQGFININNSYTSTIRARYHFVSNGDGIAIFTDTVFCDPTPNTWIPTRKYHVAYIGPFTLNDSIVQVNSGNLLAATGSLGFMQFATNFGGTGTTNLSRAQHAIYEYTNYGNQANSTAVRQGGMLATLDSGVRIFQLTNDNAVYNQRYTPSRYQRYQTEERPIMVVANELPYTGIVGWLDSYLLRNIIGANSHDIRSDGQRVVFGGTTENTDRKISTVWSGSNPPGLTMTRDGFSFQYNFTG